MQVAILGNSGSGKSTLARWLSQQSGVPSLDLDSIAWVQNEVALLRPAEEAERDVRSFCEKNSSWIIEGCYANLIRQSFQFRPTLIFLNPGEAACRANCQSRPWESHKYGSKDEQDRHLAYLLKWVSDYYTLQGDLSLAGHRACFDHYPGMKQEFVDRLEFESPGHGLPSGLDFGRE